VGRTVGAKRALKPQQVWAIRFWLDRERRLRDRAMFDLDRATPEGPSHHRFGVRQPGPAPDAPCTIAE